MANSGGPSVRDAALYAVLYLGAGAVALAFGWAAATTRTWRAADGTSHVWLGCLAAVPWLLAGAVTAWRSRSGHAGFWWPLTALLFAAWLALAVVALVRGDTAVRFWVGPLVGLGLALGVVLAVAVRSSRPA
jgi:hypothetical protein